MPSVYQKDSLQAIFGLFLEATGTATLHDSKIKSSSSLSRFLNHYDWKTRTLIQTFRTWILSQVLAFSSQGRRPHLQVIIDLTTLEKRGEFKGFGRLIRTYNRKRGLHLVCLYLVVGNWRIPWSYRIYRGKDHPCPVDLARRLLCALPKSLIKAFRVMVIADSAFGSAAFFKTVRRLKLHALVGVSKTRQLADGRTVADLPRGGQQMWLKNLPFPVSVAHYYFKREDGKLMKRYVICTRQLKVSTLRWWGKRRWQIEGWFKTAKHRFSLHRFGQQTLLGVHRWLILSLMSFVLALWGYWIHGFGQSLDWGVAAETACQFFFPSLVIAALVQDIVRLRPLALELGIDIHIVRCNI